MAEPRSIEELIEASSLGTPHAKELRASVDDATAQRVMRRVRELEAEAIESFTEDPS